MIRTNLRKLATAGSAIACAAIAGLSSGVLPGISPAAASESATLTKPAALGTPAALTTPVGLSTLAAHSAPAVTDAGPHNNALYGISCLKWTQCYAVGSRVAGNAANFRALAEEWNGRRWKVTSMPQPVTESRSLATAISCRSARRCVATGYHYSPSGSGYAPLAEYWNGKSWQIIQVRNPATTNSAFLNDVSCLAAAGCLAVGGSAGTNGDGAAIAERWTDGRWHFSRVPRPSGALATELDGIDCTGRDCVAVGMYEISSGRVLALAERWNGKSWHLLSAANARGTLSELDDVSCYSASLCMAVGESDWSQLRPLSELWENGRWRLVSGARMDGAALSGISCPDRRWCSAVGLDGNRPLTEVWKGRQWRVVPTAWAPGRQANELSQLSCGARTIRCVTVGARYRPGKSIGEATLAEWWNGRSWHLMATPNP
jgi:hypothetical protein